MSHEGGRLSCRCERKTWAPSSPGWKHPPNLLLLFWYWLIRDLLRWLECGWPLLRCCLFVSAEAFKSMLIAANREQNTRKRVLETSWKKKKSQTHFCRIHKRFFGFHFTLPSKKKIKIRSKDFFSSGNSRPLHAATWKGGELRNATDPPRSIASLKGWPHMWG